MKSGNNARRTPHGHTVRCPGDFRAYVPAPLPPEIVWDTELAVVLSRADHAMGRLAAEGRMMPFPFLLIRAFLYKEAVLSSRIEGTQVSLRELLAADAGARVEKSAEELQEVANYIVALGLRYRSIGNASAVSAACSGIARVSDAGRSRGPGHTR